MNQNTILTRQYFAILTGVMVLLLWRHIVLLFDRNVTQLLLWYLTSQYNVTIIASTMHQTVEQGIIVNYWGESSNICIHRPICLNHKHLTYNKANSDLWCRAIWVLWIFNNNIILPSSQVHICIILYIGYIDTIYDTVDNISNENDRFSRYVSKFVSFGISSNRWV